MTGVVVVAFAFAFHSQAQEPPVLICAQEEKKRSVREFKQSINISCDFLFFLNVSVLVESFFVENPNLYLEQILV